MREPSGAPARVLWSCVAAVVAALALTLGVCLVYGPATVSAGSELLRSDCGTVWEPAAAHQPCIDALTTRSWTAIVLLGLAAFGALAAVVVAARWPASVTRHLGVAGVAIGLTVLIAGVLRAGVIDRTMGP